MGRREQGLVTAKLFPPGMPVRKRVLDLLLAVPGLLILSPVLAVLAGLTWMTLGRPIFFLQVRPGYHGQAFAVYKFRTMRTAGPEEQDWRSDANRLTGLGRWLRSFSLDELPELWNVVRGEMSLVGPRPLLMQYLERYNPEQARRHDVWPGITGWVQVNGRNALTWDDKFRLDVWYVDHWSLRLDVKILALTLWKVLGREGISQPGLATAEEFMGNAGRAHGQENEASRPAGSKPAGN
jgi:sugar transferase EpsL